MALWIGGISSHKIRAVIWNLRRHSVKLRSINSHHYYHLQIIPYGSEVKLNLRRCLHSDHRSAWYIAQRCRMNFLTFLAPRIELEPRSIVMFLWSDGYWLETSLYSTSSLMWLRHVCVQWLNSDLTNMTWMIPWLSKMMMGRSWKAIYHVSINLTSIRSNLREISETVWSTWRLLSHNRSKWIKVVVEQ